jgi:hypothetical protein
LKGFHKQFNNASCVVFFWQVAFIGNFINAITLAGFLATSLNSKIGGQTKKEQVFKLPEGNLPALRNLH